MDDVLCLKGKALQLPRMDKGDIKIEDLRAFHSKMAAETLHKHGRVPLGHPGADACLQGGLCRGVLHEIFAEPGHEPPATGFTAALCSLVAGAKPILWIQPDFSADEEGVLAGAGWLELGLDPARLLLLRVADSISLLRAGHDALSCVALGAVVMEHHGPPKGSALTVSQRFMLESARTGVTAFWLRFSAPVQTSAAETRWHVKARRSSQSHLLWGTPLFEAHLARNRHGGTACFALGWNVDHGVFQQDSGTPSGAENSGLMAALAVERPFAPAGCGGE